jgi:glycosyltransferase involved in cell wall biosynthesis
MSYHANVTMVLYLVKEILPIVWAQRPEVKLIVAGKDPTREIAALADHPNITVTGTIADLRPYLQQAAIAVAPVRYGAGIQNKVLEAMACATPTITSAQAAGALSAEWGQQLLVADDAHSFAAAILQLLDDAPRRQKLGLSGRAYVEQYHHWGRIAQQLESIYWAAKLSPQGEWERN